MPLHPNWSVRFAEPITHLPPLFPRNIPPVPRRTMAQDMDLQEFFTGISENISPSTEPAIPAADTVDTVSADASASQDTTSRRLRPRRAKRTATVESDGVAHPQPARPNRSAARRKPSKNSSRAASKKKAIRRDAVLTATQAEQEVIPGTSTTTADSASQAESTNI